MLLENRTDKELVELFLSGNNKSFEFLLNRHKRKVFSFIMSKVKNYDIAEDIFQDTFIKVINSLKKGKYNEEGKFLPWIMRISHNLVIDYFRKESKTRKVRVTDEFNIFDLLDNGNIDQQEMLIKDQVYSDLNLLIEKLPEDQKKVLKMRYLEDMSFKKISEIQNISINTALGRMRYAIINLRKLADKKRIDLQIK